MSFIKVVIILSLLLLATKSIADESTQKQKVLDFAFKELVIVMSGHFEKWRHKSSQVLRACGTTAP